MAGRFVPKLDLINDNEDTNFHMSDIPWQLPWSACCISEILHW